MRPTPVPLRPDFYAVQDRTISALMRSAIATAVSAMIADASSRFMRLLSEKGPRWKQ